MKNKIKKQLAIILMGFTVFMGFLTYTAPISNADFWSDTKDLFKFEEDEQLSFTQYKGGLTELNAEGYDGSLTKSTNIKDFVVKIVNFALGFLGLAAVIVVIYGGVLYVTAAGDTDKTETGKNAIKFAAIGLLIVMGSYAFVNTIIQGTGGEGEEGNAQYVVGPTNGASFNAAAVEVRTIARDMYTKFSLFAQTINDFVSMTSDLSKSSLTSGEPSKAAILTYLNSIKIKINNIKSKSAKFSSSYNELTDFIRALDRNIDKINNTSDTVKKEIYGFIDDGTEYNEDLEKEWKKIRTKLTSNDDKYSFSSLTTLIQADYAASFEKDYNKITELYLSLGTNIQTQDKVVNAYTEMVGTDSSSYKAFKKALETDFISSGNINTVKLDKAALYFIQGLENQLTFSNELSKVKTVVARLKADVVTGSAPLIVTFDVTESVDPAGGSLLAENVDIFVEGGQVEDPYSHEKVEQDLGDAVVCNDTASAEIVGATFKQCIFQHPGTYTATTKIKSNGDFLEGSSSLLIKVDPPTTKINMNLELANGADIPVIEYYSNGLLKTNHNVIPVTIEEAQPISFDASETENVSNYRWDFGDGEVYESDLQVAKIDVISHKFKEAGTYTITLELTNQLNQVDRKIFTLEVGTIAGRIHVSPQSNIFINNPIAFSASQSSSTSGNIRDYNWEITNRNGEVLVLGSSKSKSDFSYEFREPGVYFVDLTVTNEEGSSGKAERIELEVKSKDPVAKINHDIPKTNKPSTVYLDAYRSFDPDGEIEDLRYEWRISPDSEDGKNWEIIEGLKTDYGFEGVSAVVKFNTKADYSIDLKIIDTKTENTNISEEYGEDSLDLTIDNTLDLDWGENQEVTALIEDGFAEIDFTIISEQGIAYEIGFGDGKSKNGDFEDEINITHRYASAGKYNVEVTVYDKDDNDNSMKRRFFIGGGDMPIARIGLLVNDNEVLELSEPIIVTKNDRLQFNASQSKNLDGTGRDLKYQWDFGDTNTGSSKQENHKYKELSPASTGFYIITLKVYDKDDPTKFDQDEIHINVMNEAPFFSAVQGLIQENYKGKLTTPIIVNMRVYGAHDTDGDIVKYKWWYFDFDDPEEKLGIQITENHETQMTIGTMGKEGQKLKYGFGLEITDSDGLTYSNEEAIEKGDYSSIEVINGKNAAPESTFKVNATSVLVGEEVTFTSASSDPDGQIVKYIWDFEGDGFFNNIPTDQPSLTHKYTEANLDGYEVKLKVIDDKGGESISEAVKIFVDTDSAPPVAAFKYRVVEGSKGMKVSFTNNSTSDTESGAKIQKYKWDFDTKSTLETADSDGDGEKDNDEDSKSENPTRLYEEAGKYSVKLTVFDSSGNKDEVTNEIQIPLSNPPVAAFKYKVIDGKVVFENNSAADRNSDAELEKFIWDFDTDSELDSADSDGDGDLTNDTDSTDKHPMYEYEFSGVYNVKLTVIDNQGNSDEVIREVNFTKGSSTSQNYFDGDGNQDSGNNSGNGTDPGEYFSGNSSNDNSNYDNGLKLNDQKLYNITAFWETDTAPSSVDGIIYLKKAKARLKFDFSQSIGAIAFYTIDKNILADSDGDGINDNDEDFKTIMPGTWTTNFNASMGEKVISRLTVSDVRGNVDITDIEIRFE